MDRIKVLYAEDYALTRLEVRERLEAKGWEVVEAVDGIEAFEKYKQCNPDIIILDIDMPRRSGLEVLQLIRAHDLQTPVVVYSSLAKEEDLKAGLLNGAKVYVIKNYSVDILLMQLENLLQDKKSEVMTLTTGVTYDFVSHELKIRENTVKLSMLESRVFAVLCRNKNKLSRRDLLLQIGWDSSELHYQFQLNKVIAKLRKLLENVHTLRIVMDRGNGYWLKEL